MMTIRAYRPDDEHALYEVCLRTGDHGEDASALYSDRRLLGEVFVGPYLALQPDLAYVLDDGSGAEGYALGALDTRAFEQACEHSWWPPLRESHALDGVAPEAPERWLTEFIHRPPPMDARFADAYPSHLHLDLLPRLQGVGWGGRMMGTLLAALAARGSRGVHLNVSAANTRAIRFYQKAGFVELDRRGQGLVMGRALPSAGAAPPGGRIRP